MGDRQINVSLRSHTRRLSKLRTLRMCLEIAEGSRSTIPAGECVMKTQLLDNVTSWINDDRLAAIIVQSWECALREEPETASVDDNLGPVHC